MCSSIAIDLNHKHEITPFHIDHNRRMGILICCHPPLVQFWLIVDDDRIAVLILVLFYLHGLS